MVGSIRSYEILGKQTLLGTRYGHQGKTTVERRGREGREDRRRYALY
jgi:hypothetical protein